jgi:Ni/Co efflux regulator RcnB
MRRAFVLVSALSLALSGTVDIAAAQNTPPPTTRPAPPLQPQVVGRPAPSRPVHRPRPRPPHFFRPGRGHRWARGNHLWHWDRYTRVNWRRHPFLWRPPHGYHWVFVDGQYLLVRESTGFVLNVRLGR